MKISNEEINVIKSHLVGIGVLTHFYDVVNKQSTYKINKTGMRLYTTILYLLNKNKILNGPTLSTDIINYTKSDIMKDFAINEKFIDFIALEQRYSLTHRGMEHLTVMFNTDQKGHTSLPDKIGRLIKRLKG